MDNETRLIAATDRLGRRVLPVGGERKDRYVGIFIFMAWAACKKRYRDI